MQRGGILLAHALPPVFLNSLGSAESWLTVEMAPPGGNNQYQRTVLAVSQRERCQAGLARTLLHLANSKRD